MKRFYPFTFLNPISFFFIFLVLIAVFAGCKKEKQTNNNTNNTTSGTGYTFSKDESDTTETLFYGKDTTGKYIFFLGDKQSHRLAAVSVWDKYDFTNPDNSIFDGMVFFDSATLGPMYVATNDYQIRFLPGDTTNTQNYYNLSQVYADMVDYTAGDSGLHYSNVVNLTPTSLNASFDSYAQLNGQDYTAAKAYLAQNGITTFSQLANLANTPGTMQYNYMAMAVTLTLSTLADHINNKFGKNGALNGNYFTISMNIPLYLLVPPPSPGEVKLNVIVCHGSNHATWKGYNNTDCILKFYPDALVGVGQHNPDAVARCVNECLATTACFTDICMPYVFSPDEVTAISTANDLANSFSSFGGWY